MTLLLAYAHVTALAAAALVVGGACSVLVLSILNSLYQLSLPRWIEARGMSFYLMVFQGGNAVGAAVMGLAAEHAGLSPALTIAAAGLVSSIAPPRVKRLIAKATDSRPAWPAGATRYQDPPVGQER